MSNTSTWGSAIGKFFGLSDRNKILALVLVIGGLATVLSYKMGVYGLSIIQKYVERTDTDNTRLRTENEKLQKENFDLKVENIECKSNTIPRLDTLISLYGNKNKKAK